MGKAVSGIAIEGRRILLVKKQQTWIFPGGKYEKEESDYECLNRRISEDLPGTRFKIREHYCTFIGRRPHKGDILTAEVYFINVRGEVGKPSREISEARWFSRNEIENNDYEISDITRKVIDNLGKDNYF